MNLIKNLKIKILALCAAIFFASPGFAATSHTITIEDNVNAVAQIIAPDSVSFPPVTVTNYHEFDMILPSPSIEIYTNDGGYNLKVTTTADHWQSGAEKGAYLLYNHASGSPAQEEYERIYYYIFLQPCGGGSHREIAGDVSNPTIFTLSEGTETSEASCQANPGKLYIVRRSLPVLPYSGSYTGTITFLVEPAA